MCHTQTSNQGQVMKTITVFDIAKVKSSNINEIAFGGNSIYINFKNGKTYSYEGATLDQYEDLKKAESVGKHFHSHIKSGGYECQEVLDTKFKQESKITEDEQLMATEIRQLKQERTDLYQALRIKQEKIEELEDFIQFELKKKEA